MMNAKTVTTTSWLRLNRAPVWESCFSNSAADATDVSSSCDAADSDTSLTVASVCGSGTTLRPVVYAAKPRPG